MGSMLVFETLEQAAAYRELVTQVPAMTRLEHALTLVLHSWTSLRCMDVARTFTEGCPAGYLYSLF